MTCGTFVGRLALGILDRFFHSGEALGNGVQLLLANGYQLLRPADKGCKTTLNTQSPALSQSLPMPTCGWPGMPAASLFQDAKERRR